MVFSVARNCSGWAAARPRHQHRDDGSGDERSTRRHVTYDVRDGYVASAPELRQPIVALMSLDVCGERSRSRCCPTMSASCCSSMVGIRLLRNL
jgi:hypothetical protein